MYLAKSRVLWTRIGRFERFLYSTAMLPHLATCVGWVQPFGQIGLRPWGRPSNFFFRARVAPHLSFRIHLSVGCQAVLDFSWPLSAKGEEAGLVSVGEYIPLPETLSRPFLRAPLQKRAEKASVSGLSFLSRVFTFSMQRLSGSNR